MFYGKEPYFQSGWNIMDGSLVTVSIVDILMSLISDSSPRIFGILRVSNNGYNIQNYCFVSRLNECWLDIDNFQVSLLYFYYLIFEKKI